MKTGTRSESVWGLGLSEEEERTVRDALAADTSLRNWPKDKLPRPRDLEREQPALVFMRWEVFSSISKAGQRLLDKIDSSRRVLVVGEGSGPVDFEEVLSNGFLTALHAPLSRTKILDTVYRAREMQGLYDDICRMTHEIILEREILTRKTDQLLFLNQILTRASETLDVGTILSCAREDLAMLFPVSGIYGVFWMPPESELLETEIFLREHMSPEVQDAWVEHLLESASRFSSHPVQSYQITYFKGAGGRPRQEEQLPQPGRVIVLPLKTGPDHFGCLTLVTPEELRLAKDQVQTLHAAVRHLALALRNAMAFSKVKTRADHDGLTRIYNRNAFEERLVEELKRHQRYRHEVSILLMDLDHFKQINDSYGHQAGDLVLKETAKILLETLRATDFVARYGGEEFIVILPHTTEEQAWMLAERLRTKIAKKCFEDRGHVFRLTASLGVASLKPGALSTDNSLVRMADQALYLAKANGRNMVCTSSGGEAANAAEN